MKTKIQNLNAMKQKMKILSDFHSHTDYADGKNTPEEMVLSAIELGISEYGISEHVYMPNPPSEEYFGMDESKFEKYVLELTELKEKYRGKINLHIGTEVDGMGKKLRAEYVIGSTHVLEKDGEMLTVDDSEETLKDACERLFSGDWYKLCEAYYEQEAKIAKLTDCDIIGHFDLITKFNQDGRLFDESCDAYLEPAISAMKELLYADVPFEINTGAISRGYRREPYPSRRLLKELKSRGGMIMINSDSHSKDTLLYKFDMARRLALECGFEYALIPDCKGGYKRTEL